MLDKEKQKAILSYFAQYIEQEVGIVYSEFNDFQLIRRLEDIATLMNYACIEELYQKAQKGIHGDFKTLVLDTATNNETSFFRDTRAFDLLRDTVVPELLSKTPTTSLQIWSAACSSGQEAISVAILLKEIEAKFGKKIDFTITATDISERILEKAQKGIYTQLEVQRGLPAPHLIKYFEATSANQWKIKDSVSSHIQYKKMNLKLPCSFAFKFDLALCRNMLIYQNLNSKKQIVKRISENMNNDSFLLLGAGESLLGVDDSFSSCSQQGSIYYKKMATTQRAAS